MRYVILFATIALFLIWDALYNDTDYLNAALRWVIDMMRAVGIR